jgi:hypothetical protein
MQEGFIDYALCTKEELIKLVMNRDDEFVDLGNKYLIE